MRSEGFLRKCAGMSYLVKTRHSMRKGKKHTMKKVICKVEYDTEASKLIEKRTSGAFGDPAGYEESLYQTEGGKFFLYGAGGEASKYPEETIKRLSADKAQEWLSAKA